MVCSLMHVASIADSGAPPMRIKCANAVKRCLMQDDMPPDPADEAATAYYNAMHGIKTVIKPNSMQQLMRKKAGLSHSAFKSRGARKL